MAKVIPKSSVMKPQRRHSLVPNILSLYRSSSSLDSFKFNECLANDLTSGFEESEKAFSDIRHKAASILDAEECFIYVLDDKEHKLYTFLKDGQGNEVKLTKPLDRGITGFVLSDETGINLSDVSHSSQWSKDLDELMNRTTVSYLAWPIWGLSGECIGVIEFRNKNRPTNAVFNSADVQLSQIIAFQIGRAIVENRQQALLDGHNHAMNLAYEQHFDSSDSVTIENDFGAKTGALESSDNSTMIIRKALLKQRSAMALTPSWTWKQPSHTQKLSDRDWSYDVFLHSEDDLIMHTVDIFDERGLFSNFSIPVTTFVNFVKEIKAGYNSYAPYHNYHHAFDVMHVSYLLITKCKADDYLDSFNILSILVGALAHDLGHDGFNNAFHTVTNSELAIMYNGVSILENYSAAYLFRILRKQKCNIFARFSENDMNKLRTRLIDLILDTDAKNHFMLMTRFKHSMELKQVSRGLLSSMILHVSDVSNPTRPGPIARKWAFAVQEEFFRQGDKEKVRKILHVFDYNELVISVYNTTMLSNHVNMMSIGVEVTKESIHGSRI